ncbi:MAG: ferritin family protein [Nanoarchaeota archaeon]
MELQKALQTALDFEKKGQHIYEEEAEKTKNPFVRRVFTYLAEQEENHIREINDFIKKHHPDAHLSGDRQEEVKQFFTMTLKEFTDRVKASKEDLAAYETGLELERSAYNFYKEECEYATDEKVKDFFSFLMHQESAHYTLIRNAYDYIKDPANFHMEEEGWMFEG